MKRLTFLAISILLPILNLPGVDLNPLSANKRLGVDFNHGLGECSVTGDVKNEKISFINAGMILRGDASATYSFSSPTEGDAFTLWAFLNTNNVSRNPETIVLSDSLHSLVFGFREQNGCPFLKFFEGNTEKLASHTEMHIDGEAWRLIALRKKGSLCDLLINGKVVASFTLPENCVFPAKSKLQVTFNSKKQSDIDVAYNRFDNLFFYDMAFDDELLLTHYNDEMRAHRAGALVKTPPRKEPEQYVFELDASKTENALANGSFELGTKGWHLYSDLERGIEKCRIEGDSPHGKYKMRLEGEKVIFQHYPIFVRKAGDFTISFMARELEEKSSIKLRLRRLNTFASPRNTYHKNFDALGKEFQHYSVSGNLPPDAKGIFLEFEIHGKVELDMMQLHGGEEARTTYAETAPRIMIDTTRPYNIFSGDIENVEFIVFRSPGAPEGTLSIYDEKDRLLQEVKIPAEGDLLQVPFTRKGAFRAVASCNGRVSDEHTFAVLHAPLRKGVSLESRYGCHYQNTPFMLEFAPLIGSHWNRNHDAGPYVARWNAKTKPIDGNFSYRFDIFDLNADNAQELIATLTGPWKENESTAEEFGNNIYEMVRTYKGRLKYIEIFNEPTAWFPPERYAEFMKSAYNSAKKADPEVKILGLSTWDVVGNFTQKVVENAGCENMDIFSAHFYNWGEGAWLIPDGSWGQGFRMRKLRNYLDSRPHGKELPIWHTESGIYMDSFYLHFPLQQIDTTYVRASVYPHHPPRLGALWMAQVFPVNFANGAEVFTYYAWGPTFGGILRMNGHNLGEINGTPKPSGAAYAASAHFLDYSEFVKGIDDLTPNGLRAFQFRRDGKNIVVAWTQGPEVLTLKKAPQVCYDYMGNRIDTSQTPNTAFLNFNGVQKEVPITGNPGFFLDLEVKYFPGMTLDEFISLMPEKESANIKIHMLK